LVFSFIFVKKYTIMEIAKEKFIETFKKECDKAKQVNHIDSFRTSGSVEEPIAEIISNKEVSFLIIKMSNNDEKNTYSFEGKIIFGGFVDYKSISISEEEFESLYDYFMKCELDVRRDVKNDIIKNGEFALNQIFN